MRLLSSMLLMALLLLPAPLLAQSGRRDNDQPEPRALEHWLRGQEHMRGGRMREAIDCFEQSLAADSRLTRNYLSLAAAYLELGQDSRACLHLTLYVAAHPDHLSVRMQYAELLHRLDNLGLAREQFERFIADAQDIRTPSPEQLIHCHSRLMEIGVARQDEYDEHLHRGIGLYLLACHAQDLDKDGPSSRSALLCRAAAELTLARGNRPDEARPLWYLHVVWTQLAQQQPAGASLRAAEEAAPFSYLTPAENRGLYLAARQREGRGRR